MVQLLAHQQYLVFTLLFGRFLPLLVALVVLTILVAIREWEREADREHARAKLAIAAVLAALDAEAYVGKARFARQLCGRRRLFDFLFQYFELGLVQECQGEKSCAQWNRRRNRRKFQRRPCRTHVPIQQPVQREPFVGETETVGAEGIVAFG